MLSAVIITKNEEKKIVDCLNSVGWADEVVVVDDESQDNTVAICERYGAKVIVSKSNNNLGKQRNLGIEAASGDWVLQLDADEIIPEETAIKIKTVVNSPGIYVAFAIQRKNFLLGHPLNYSNGNIRMIKLFRKNVAYYQGYIHEQLVVDGRVGKINECINHYPAENLTNLLSRWNYYSLQEANLFFNKNQEVSYAEIKYRLGWKSLKLFYKLYIKKKGYRDGMYGFIWCILNVIEPQLRWVKIWEKAIKHCRLEEENRK